MALRSFLTRDGNGRRPYPGRILLARHADFAAAPQVNAAEQIQRL